MFEKLFLLVKSNANNPVFNNPCIPATKREAVINEASSSIIEVLKTQLESGRLKDLIGFFQFSDAKDSSVVKSMINRFANKLNNFYCVEPKAALLTATALIIPVMQQIITRSHNNLDAEFEIHNFISKLSGGTNLTALVNNYMTV